MPDIICPNCKEPWDAYHLRHDAIWETNMPDHVKENWDGILTDEIRESFKVVGWEFGERTSHIIRCESCPEGETRVTTRSMAAEALADLLGDDEDGFIAMMEDAEYMYGDDLDL